MDWTLIVCAVIGLLGSGVIGGRIGARSSASKVLSEAVVNLIKPLSDRVEALTARVTALELENRELKRTVDTLLNLVRRMWAVIRDNDVDIDADLAGDIYEAIEDSTA